MKKTYSILIILAFIVFFTSHAQASTTICVDLSRDLSYGELDTENDHSIRILQTYLQSKNYLTATPNGRFGPSTLTAVKLFQSNNSISPIGRVGPSTRNKLRELSCGSKTSPTPTTTNTPATTQNNIQVTSPASGSVLTIGKNITISWNSNPGYIYDIILERPGGSGAGFVAYNQSGNTTYSWQIGKVFSSAINDYENVATGTYRIRIEKSSQGMSDSDYVSGWFTVEAEPLSLNSMMPRSASNNNRNPVVLFGTGFNNSTVLRFDGRYGISASSFYISPDGTVMVFTVPEYISAGTHQITLENSTNIVSNPFNLSVTQSN